MLNVIGEDCGCTSKKVNTTSVICSGWTAVGQACFFQVRTLSEDCGFFSDPVNNSVILDGQSLELQLRTCMLIIFSLTIIINKSQLQEY